jgi:type II secretory pathway predicted ATPase ExeA
MAPEERDGTAGLAVPLRRVDTVLAAIRRPTQLVVVIGDEGLGKTTLCQSIARRLGPRMFCSQICTPPSTPEALRARLLADFGIPREEALEEDALLLAFCESLEKLQECAVVILDNAHDAAPAVLDELLRISAFTAGSSKPLQVVLAGRPSLRLLLDTPGIRAVAGSASTASIELAPLGEREIRHFIERRWWVSQGGADALQAAITMPRLTRSAVRVIARASLGNPGAVSDICDRALAATANGGSLRLTGAEAKRLASDAGLHVPVAVSWRAPAAAALVVAIAAGTLFAASLGMRARPPVRAQAQDEAGPQPNVVVREPAATPDAPHGEAAPVETFQTFQSEVLARATRLSTQPDVLSLLKIHDDVKSWDARSGYADHAAAETLLDEVDRLTNEARQRQLVYDGNLLRHADH